MNTLGTETKSLWANEFRGLHREFAVAAAVHVGQPVKLTDTGLITPLVAGDDESLCIGISIHDQATVTTGLATVAMRARGVVEALAGAAVVCGPVKFASYDATTGKCKYIASAAALANGWAIEAGAADGSEIQVAIL